MATRPKSVIESHDGEKFSPITIAKNVLTDDGQNLQDILSDRKEDMMTPTIGNSSSMFKVGQGDNVDYSDNVVNGAYESCVLKGRSLVNLINFSNSVGSANANKNGDTLTITAINNDAWSAKSFELNGMSHNKTYIACWDSLTFTHSHETGKRTVVGIYASDDEGNQVTVAEIDKNQSFNYLIFTLPAKADVSKKVQFRVHATTWEGELGATTTIKGAKVLEYQEGMENWDIPYFEGLCDVKSPILLNCGKNLFDEQRHSNPDNFFVHSAYWSIPIQLKGNTEYKFSYTFNNVLDKQVVMRFATCKWTSTDHSSYPYSLGQVLNKNITSNLMGKTESMSFVTPTDGLVYLHYYNSELTNSPSSFNLASWYTHILKDIQLEESSTSTQCEPYKSNTVTFNQKDNKTIVLRSLPNGVCDTLNVETGEYVQRIGEVILDGSENWNVNNTDGTTTYRFFCDGILPNSAVDNTKGVAQYLCDKLKTTVWSQTCELGITVNGAGVFIYNKSIDYNRASVIEWLKENHLKLQYELTIPITKTVDLSGYPYAYTNGHVQLSSGSIEPSLTPTVEYSLVANRNGQIRSNQRMVERHQKQLDRLQAMILTNLVNTQYEQTLTNLKYDLKNVREEVK